MPVLEKEHHQKLDKELVLRFKILLEAFEGRELKKSTEGVKGRGHWIHPEKFTATCGGSLELRLAVDDFKNILAEIRKLK